MATNKFEQGVSLVTTSRTTTSTTYTVTEDRKPIWRYDSSVFDAVTAIYLELNGRVTNPATGTIGLHDDSGTIVTGAEAVTTQAGTPNSRTRSGDIKANLTTGTDYHIKYKTSTDTLTVDSAKIIIIHNGGVTKTEINIELGERLNVTTTYAEPTNYATWLYTAAEYEPAPTAYFEATLKPSNAARTVYAQLYDVTAGAAVAGSEVTHTGDTVTTRKRSAAITLVDGHSYRPQVKGDSGSSEDVTCTRLLIQQSGSLVKTTVYFPILNSSTANTGASYTNQDREMLFDGSSNWSVSSALYYYEANIKVSVGVETGYYQLYNETDTAQIGEVTTTATVSTRVRTASLTMPSDDGNSLDGGRKSSGASEIVSSSRAYLIAILSLNVDAATAVKDLIMGGIIPFAR